MNGKESQVSVSREQSRRHLSEALHTVQRGKFVQISRISGQGELPVVAHRFTGDLERFERTMTQAFDDAGNALSGEEWLKIEITD
jgi:hypothetical protein